MKQVAPHIVQYQGSKRNLAPQILPYFPRKFNRLIEPFAGMAAITIATAQQKRADEYVINDINFPLMTLLESAIETPELLAANYDKLWKEQFDYANGSVDHYYHVRDLFNNGEQEPEKILYLLARCVKGSVRYGKNGKFNQSPDKRRNGTNPKTLATNVLAISGLLKNKALFMSTDYREVLEIARPGDLVYMDPPYQGVSNVRDCRYLSGIDFNDFVEAVDSLNRRGIDFVISYDGKCGEKEYGNDLPEWLDCEKVYLTAGISSQAVLLGKKDITYEALYISRNLKRRPMNVATQMSIFEELAV